MPRRIIAHIWMGSVLSPAAGVTAAAIHLMRRLTPTPGAHNYNIRAWMSPAGTGSVSAGAGGIGTVAPGFLRATKAIAVGAAIAPPQGGLEANRPAASAMLAGLRYFATDTLNDWLCNGYTWLTNTPTAWANLTMQNAWVSYGTGYAPQYRKIGDEVQIRGLMKSGATSTAAFTLPVGFRPAYEESFVELGAGALSAISIATNGIATVQPPTPTAPTYMYLSGIRFSTVA
jgi:hypothetical protein